MQAYLIRIFTMSLLCGLAESLSPAGEREGLRRAVRLLTALCLLCLMIAPLHGMRDEIGTFDLGALVQGMEGDGREELEQLMEEKLSVVTCEQWKADLRYMLCEQFGIDGEDYTLTVDWEEENNTVTVHGVWIELRGKAVLCDPRTIEAAVENAWQCPCTVSVG